VSLNQKKRKEKSHPCKTLVDNFVHGGLLVPRAGDDVLVVHGDIAAQHRGRLLGLGRKTKLGSVNNQGPPRTTRDNTGTTRQPGKIRDHQGQHRDNQGQHRDNQRPHRDNQRQHRDNQRQPGKTEQPGIIRDNRRQDRDNQGQHRGNQGQPGTTGDNQGPSRAALEEELKPT